MKKLDGKKFTRVFLRFVVAALVLVLIFVLPGLSLGGMEDEMSFIYKSFLGSKSKYQGVIEIWNIDTFESGTASKTSYLSDRAKEYQRQNKGVYFLIRNLTEQECLNMLSKGQTPDMFSCSYGVAEEIKEFIQAYKFLSDISIKEEFLNAGKSSGELYGLAWCRGVYCLISTARHLEAAKVEDISGVKLSDIALTSGYTVKNKNSEKVVYSLSYGVNKYLLPNRALSSYNSSELESISEHALDIDAKSQTQYSAYCNFIAGQASVLLGTQRDVARMENRVKLGKASDVIYQPLTSFTDLVQFMFIAKSEDNSKCEIAEGFAKFLTAEQSQKKLADIGMFSVANISENPYKSGVMFDIASEINGIQACLNVFVTKSEIEKLQKDFMPS